MQLSHRLAPLLLALACIGAVSSCSDEPSSADASLATGSDAQTGGPDAQPSAFTPAYDDQGCLTFASANEMCAAQDSLLCTSSVGCGHSDEGQCSIDCTMATVLCLDSPKVTACIAAVESGTCTDIAACQGWLYF